MFLAFNIRSVSSQKT